MGSDNTKHSSAWTGTGSASRFRSKAANHLAKEVKKHSTSYPTPTILIPPNSKQSLQSAQTCFNTRFWNATCWSKITACLGEYTQNYKSCTHKHWSNICLFHTNHKFENQTVNKLNVFHFRSFKWATSYWGDTGKRVFSALACWIDVCLATWTNPRINQQTECWRGGRIWKNWNFHSAFQSKPV